MDDKKPLSEARKKANAKWNAKAYDRINIAVPKGYKDRINAIAEQHGQSLNSFIKDAIRAKIEQNDIDFEWKE